MTSPCQINHNYFLEQLDNSTDQSYTSAMSRPHTNLQDLEEVNAILQKAEVQTQALNKIANNRSSWFFSRPKSGLNQ